MYHHLVFPCVFPAWTKCTPIWFEEDCLVSVGEQSDRPISALNICTCMYTCIHTCMHACIHTYIYIYMCYVCIYLQAPLEKVLNYPNLAKATSQEVSGSLGIYSTCNYTFIYGVVDNDDANRSKYMFICTPTHTHICIYIYILYIIWKITKSWWAYLLFALGT